MAKNAEFQALAAKVAAAADAARPADEEALAALVLARARRSHEDVAELASMIGEKMEMRPSCAP